MDLLAKLSRDAPDHLDLTNPDHLETVRASAELLESAVEGPAELEVIEFETREDPSLPVLVRVALKLAISRLQLQGLSRPVHVSVV